MDSSEQAAPQGADSLSIEQRIGNFFGNDTPAPKQPKPAPAPQAQEATEESPNEPTDQAPNDEETASETSNEESTAPQYSEVEFEGRQYQVPPELKDAIIRHADYTQKTQALAEQRKVFEHQQAQMRAAHIAQEFNHSIAPQLSEIAQIDAQLAQYDKVNWREIPADERSLHMLEMQRLEKLKDAKEKEVELKRGEHSKQFHEQLAKLQSDAAALLKQRIPSWGEASAKEVRDWALNNGFTQDEVSSIHDPRHAEVLWKAAQYDKAKSSAKPVIAQAKAAKPSSANPMPQHVKDKLAFNKRLNATAPNSPERKATVEQRVGSLFSKRG
jgi:hypothetical protein